MSRSLGPFRAAVFDLDGTLVDSYDAIHDALSVVLRTFGRPPISRAQVRVMVGHGLEVLIARTVGAQNVVEGVRVFRERYAVVGPASTVLLPGAEEVTLWLFERGIPQAIASNKPARFSRQILERLGILERFAAVLGPDQGFPAKPAPDMVFHALEEMGVTPSETLYVGDMAVDVETARAAGLAVAVLPTGSCDRAELEAAGPDYLLSLLVEVPGFFRDREALKSISS